MIFLSNNFKVNNSTDWTFKILLNLWISPTLMPAAAENEHKFVWIYIMNFGMMECVKKKVYKHQGYIWIPHGQAEVIKLFWKLSKPKKKLLPYEIIYLYKQMSVRTDARPNCCPTVRWKTLWIKLSTTSERLSYQGNSYPR